MGIEDLWKALDPVAYKQSLLELTTRYALQEAHVKHKQKYIIGVDANLWIAQCQHAFRSGHAQSGENPELRTLFYKLARLHNNLVDVILVFDGPQRPPLKRGRHVITHPPWLTQRLSSIADAFGFPSYTAPGEAEAELAKLNRNGIIDAVLTEDSDAVVFGADMVIRSDKETDDGVVCYSSIDISVHHGVQLSRGGLLSMALLCGGDYHPGLLGCGWRTALGVAKYGLGDDLLRAATDENIDDLASYAKAWVDELRLILTRDHLHHIGRRCGAIADSIPNDFPSLALILNYTSPVTSDMERAIELLASPRELNIRRLAFLCEFHFGWSRYQNPRYAKSLESSGTLGKLQSLVFEGAFLRALYKHLCSSSSDGKTSSQSDNHEPELGPHSVIRILRQHRRSVPPPATSFSQDRVEIKTDILVKAAKHGINEVMHLGESGAALYLDTTTADPGRCRVWVPVRLTELVLGHL